MTIRVIHVSILHFGSTRYSGSTNDGKGEMRRLEKMIAERYDNETLMSLKGEIFFDLELSKADVDMARSAYQGVIHRPLPAVVYLPCSGTLRHVPALLGSGVKKVVAVDLSLKSLTSGRAFFGLSSLESVEIYHQDIRQIETFVPPGGFDLAIMLGNSLGDATDLNSHNECIEAIARSLSDHGVVLFDYVSDRYCSGLATAPTPTTSTWPERLALDDGTEVKVTDKRSREYQVVCPGIGILRFQGEVAAESGEILTAYTYEKLVVADDILIEQFRRAGLDLRSMGSVARLSPYHRRRVDTFDDLGMLGTPNHLYLARKI